MVFSSPLRCVLAVSLTSGLILLAGCDQLGIESPEKVAAMREAEGKATGAACRHAGRAIEDCFTLNRKADRSAVFAGWRDMNDYMRENKIEPVAPELPPPGLAAKPKPAEIIDEPAAPASRAASKAEDSGKAKRKPS
jgi:hypothetical protein